MCIVVDITKLIGGTLEGDGTAQLQGFVGIEQAKVGGLGFLANMKYEPLLYTTHASVVLVNEKFTLTRPCSTTLICVANPHETLSQLMRLYASQQKSCWTDVHPTATVSPSVTIPKECTIGPYACIEADVKLGEQVVISAHCAIGANCSIGDHTTLHPRVTLYSDSVIGRHRRIHAGTAIGVDGFGFAPTEHDYNKILQTGYVEIGDNTEIGANSCIDRAMIGVMRIASGVRIDNLVQIAYNCTVDEHTVIAAQVGLAGSAHVKEWCQLGGQVDITGHLTMGDHLQLGGQTDVSGNLQPYSVVMGAPTMLVGRASCAFAMLPKLPELIRRVNRFEE